MLAPTPALRPSPMDIGDLFSASFTAIKRRFGLFALLTLLPAIVTMVVVAVGVMLIVLSLAAVAADASSTPTGMFLVGIVVLAAGAIIGALAQLKSYGLMSLAAYEIGQGTRPTLRGLLDRSRGFLPRMAILIVIGFGVGVLVYGLFFALILATVGTAASSQSSGAIAAVAGLMLLLGIAIVPVALFFATKLLYTVPAIAIEGLGGVDGLKRSWSLTRGSFWRTLGYFLVAYIAVAAVSSFASGISQVFVLRGRTTSIPPGASADEMLGRLAFILPVMLITIGLQLVVSLFTVPFLQAYTTYMFIDQVHRSELPPAPAWGYGPAQPQSYPPAPGYPQQGYPQQSYPQQGGYPQQGYTPGGYYSPPGQYYNPPASPQQDPYAPPQYPGQQYPPAPDDPRGQQPPQQGWNPPQAPDGGPDGQQPR